jgi:hypothetical protein
VVVQGASSLLSQVTAVQLDVPLAKTPGALDVMERPIPVDAIGHEVRGLVIEPDLVRAQVRFVRGTGSAPQP